MKKPLNILCAMLTVALLLTVVAVPSASAKAPGYIEVTGFDASVDYSARMRKCAQDGSEYAMQMGWIYEQQRNLKIEMLNMPYSITTYFTDYSTGQEIVAAMDKPKRIARMKKEYPVAGYVYEYLTVRDYSDAVIAGILGNMMAEVGGQTLDLGDWKYWSTGGYSDYYGLCQWSVYYNPYIVGRDVEGQLDYLIDSMPGAFGKKYEQFLNLTDAGEAARWFSDTYERPACWAMVRATNAATALAWIQK